MPRWTRDRSLGVLPRARDFITPGGFRVPTALLWLQLAELAQRHGVTLTALNTLIGIGKGATFPERVRRMRILTFEEVFQVETWVQRAIQRHQQQRARSSNGVSKRGGASSGGVVRECHEAAV